MNEPRTFNDVLNEATTLDDDGKQVIDVKKLDGPGLHDVDVGPCKCGAWH